MPFAFKIERLLLFNTCRDTLLLDLKADNFAGSLITLYFAIKVIRSDED